MEIFPKHKMLIINGKYKIISDNTKYKILSKKNLRNMVDEI